MVSAFVFTRNLTTSQPLKLQLFILRCDSCFILSDKTGRLDFMYTCKNTKFDFDNFNGTLNLEKFGRVNL